MTGNGLITINDLGREDWKNVRGLDLWTGSGHRVTIMEESGITAVGIDERPFSTYSQLARQDGMLTEESPDRCWVTYDDRFPFDQWAIGSEVTGKIIWDAIDEVLTQAPGDVTVDHIYIDFPCIDGMFVGDPDSSPPLIDTMCKGLHRVTKAWSRITITWLGMMVSAAEDHILMWSRVFEVDDWASGIVAETNPRGRLELDLSVEPNSIRLFIWLCRAGLVSEGLHRTVLVRKK